MGWNSGSGLFSDIILTLKANVEDHEARVNIYEDLINVFENADCDTLNECLDEDDAFNEAFRNLRPEYFEENE